MFFEILKDKFLKNREKYSLFLDEQSWTYFDILKIWDEWNLELKKRRIPVCSVVMIRSDFSLKSIGLILALMEHGSIVVPVSLAVKEIVLLKKIAEVTHYFDLENSLFIETNVIPFNLLITELFKQSHPGLVLFTSGTTGEPKAVLHDLTLMFSKYIDKGKSLKSIAFLLFDHIGGFNTLFYHLFNGGSLVVPVDRSAERIAFLIEKFQVELLPTSPSFLNIFLLSRAYEKYNMSSLKLVTYGTEPMPKSTMVQFNKIFPNVRLKQTYGLSELGIFKTESLSSDSLWMKMSDSQCQVNVRDGILWIKSKLAMVGYLNKESPFDQDGWFNTNDQVETNGNYFRIVGRATDIINVGGLKVYPIEIEEVILKIPGVREVFVQAEPNFLMGNVIVCHVYKSLETSEDLLKKEIKKVCLQELGKYKTPSKIVFSSNSFYSNRLKSIRDKR